MQGRGRAGDDDVTLRAAAARNNADWCDAFCRSRGISGRFEPECWSSARRTPPLYPDAVTLVPGVAPELLLSRIDTREGCSVKDSFADVDLAAAGLRTLFRAEWVAWTEPARAGGWTVVRANGPVADLARDDSRAVATCTAGVIGLTNVAGADFAAAWLGAAAAAQARWGPLPVVGYEMGSALEAVREAGVRSLGELTVWVK